MEKKSQNGWLGGGENEKILFLKEDQIWNNLIGKQVEKNVPKYIGKKFPDIRKLSQ